jgi:hypothetical protein
MWPDVEVVITNRVSRNLNRFLTLSRGWRSRYELATTAGPRVYLQKRRKGRRGGEYQDLWHAVPVAPASVGVIALVPVHLRTGPDFRTSITGFADHTSSDGRWLKSYLLHYNMSRNEVGESK